VDSEAVLFLERMCTEFGINPPVSLKSRLAEDLGFDSLNVLELVVWIEETAAGEQLEVLRDYPILMTVADAVSLHRKVLAWVCDYRARVDSMNEGE
jgi:acyl carrier protein